MDSIIAFAHKTVLGISLQQYAVAFIFTLAGYLARFVLQAILNRAVQLAKRTRHDYDDVVLDAIRKPVAAAAVLAGVWLALDYLPLPVEPFNIEKFAFSFLKSVSVGLGVWLLLRLTNRIADVLMRKAAETPSPLDDQLVPVGRNTLKVFFVLIGAVAILQDLGYSVTSLVAGLGIGGMAVAFASKDTLANLFGSMVIFIDRPFHIGDWIEMGEVEGTVEEIGLRVTRIRTFANSLITIPNAQFTTTVINNWSRMRKRRIKLTLGLTYDTTVEQMEQAVESIRRVIREDEKLDHGFFLVNFSDFNAYSLDIFIYCFTVTTNWAEYLQARQELLLKFMGAIRSLGLDFAFPTQTIQLAGVKDDKKLPGEPESMQRELPK